MKRTSTLLRLLKSLSCHRGCLLLSLITAAAGVFCQLYIPILTGQAIDAMIGRGQVDFAGIFAICRNLLLYIAVTAVAQWLLGWCNNRMAFSLTRSLRCALADKFHALPVSMLDRHSTGDLLSRMISDAEQLSDGLLLLFSQLFTGVLTILGTLAFMLAVNRPITLVVVLVTPLSLVVAAFIARRTHQGFRRQNAIKGRQSGFVNEMISGQNLIHAFGREEQTLSEFDALNEQLHQASRKAVFYSSLTNPCTRFVNGLVYVGVGLVGALSAAGLLPVAAITVGQLSVFLSYANQYTKPFNDLSGMVTELQNALTCAERIFAVLDEAEQSPDETGTLHPDGSVALERVSFRYHPDQPLIEDFSLSVKPGQRVAIVGPTGSGKTTLINLLMRFYDVDGGKITVGGTDIRTVPRGELRRSYGMVLQDTWLKSGTVAENIAYGNPAATREEIVQAAKTAHAHSFISRLPMGYDTLIGEGGASLSEGQRQLLCIARCLLVLPEMLILDEATSSIDTRTELKIQSAFHTMMAGRTSFIVAHRLSTIRNADVILVMRDGRIVEQGSHEALLEQNGFYAQLYESQFDENEP